jgi:Na+/glutamate symporter
MAMASLRLWELASLALPLTLILNVPSPETFTALPLSSSSMMNCGK